MLTNDACELGFLEVASTNHAYKYLLLVLSTKNISKKTGKNDRSHIPTTPFQKTSNVFTLSRMESIRI